ncbi:hypothetical protein MBEHAL_0492 [Halarchaeum acidiphilum MH1-52-1]|uniref:Uncharacterized protein n=1 Tax=Halarchaeum acidiphilum MH1-52-1 TaxID=1261545 RepID=U2YSL6_9EURY|nr:hypothetical protein [Halarchaeum acidiphilum]GAD51732.1 hypothetical protein MBEHAL_0492 [Halarchaeum acidiphilum MH1-52-1]
MAPTFRRFGYLGAFLLVLAAGFFAAFGAPALDGSTGLQIVVFVVAGVFELLGGFANPLRERVGALRLVGIGHVCLGASMCLGALSGSGLVFQALFVLSGLVLVAFGVDYLLGGRYFETPEA